MIRLAVFDIDGTLIVPETGVLDPRTLNAIRRLKNRGVKTAIASGRLLQRIRPELLDLGFDFYILTNGSCITDSTGLVLHKESIDAPTIEALIQEMQERDYPLELRYISGHVAVNPRNSIRAYLTSVWGADRMKKEHDDQALPFIPTFDQELPISCVGYIPMDQRDYFIHKFPQLEFLAVFGGPIYDINKAGVSKATGLATVCSRAGIDLGSTIVFGDDRNDLEIIKTAGIGVAMGNASEDVKNVANYITDTCETLGVVKGLQHFGLLD